MFLWLHVTLRLKLLVQVQALLLHCSLYRNFVSLCLWPPTSLYDIPPTFAEWRVWFSYPYHPNFWKKSEHLPIMPKTFRRLTKHCGRCSYYFQGLLNVDVQSAKSWHHLAKIMEAKYHEILPRSNLHTQDCKYLGKITYFVFFFSGIVHCTCKIIVLYACDQSFWSAGVKNTCMMCVRCHV